MRTNLSAYIFLVGCLIFLSSSVFGQVSFQRVLGGALNENIYSFVETGAGYLFVGSTNTNGAGGDDILVVETDLNYNIVTSKTFGGTQDDFPRSVIKCSDGGYAIIGSTYSFGAGDEEIILIKLTPALNLSWVKTYGGSNVDRGFCILEDQSNFVLGATTKNGNGALIIKTDPMGNILWSNTYGFHENSTRCFSSIQRLNGNYLFTGPYQSMASSFDFMLIEVSSSGVLIQAPSYNAGGNDHTRDVLEVAGEGTYILGHSTSFGNGTWDLLLVKLDVNGDFEWARNFGYPFDIWASQLIMTSDNKLLLTGHLGLFSEYNNDLVVLKCDRAGHLDWSKSYGGANVENQKFGNHETIYEIQAGEYLTLGQTSSFGSGGEDIYIVGFDDNGISECNYHDLSIGESSVNLQTVSISLPVNVHVPTVTNPSIVVGNIILDNELLCPLLSPPIAGFQASSIQLCVENCIDFTDASLNLPSIWDWFFEGGTPQNSSLVNPVNICYSDTGCFDVQLIVSNSAGSDTLLMDDYICVHPKPEVDLGPDTILCDKSDYQLFGPLGYYQYLWNNGSFESNILVDSTGMYWLEVEDNNGCVSRDSVFIGFGYSYSVDLGNDTVLCQGDTITLSTSMNYSSYRWNDGSEGSSLDVGNSGIYWVEVSDIYGCYSSDSIQLDIIEIPELIIGQDTSFCEDFMYLLSAGAGYDSYLWQDGSQGQDFLTTSPDTYWVRVSKDGCEKSDTVQILHECPTNIWFPNCFTPNGDGVNDIFKPVCQNISKYKMYVFNRWGQQIFESYVTDIGWDGKFNGKVCPNGVYFFLARYLDNEKNLTEEITGSITLLR